MGYSGITLFLLTVTLQFPEYSGSSYYYSYTAKNDAVAVSTGVIVGCVIAGIVFIGSMVALVIFCICKCNDTHRGNRVAVVHAAPFAIGDADVTIVSSNIPMHTQRYYGMHVPHHPTYPPLVYPHASAPPRSASPSEQLDLTSSPLEVYAIESGAPPATTHNSNPAHDHSG